MAMGLKTKFLVALMLLINALLVINTRRARPELPRAPEIIPDCFDCLGGRDNHDRSPGGATVVPDDQDRNKKGNLPSPSSEGGVEGGAGGGLRASSQVPRADDPTAAAEAAVPGGPGAKTLPDEVRGGDVEQGRDGGSTVEAATGGGERGDGGEPDVLVVQVERPDNETEECKSMMKTLRIVPDESWGKATKAQQRQWATMGCDGVIARVVAEKAGGGGAAGSLGLPDCTARPSTTSDPLIAICAGSTTRGVRYPDEYSLALFRFLLPSIARTADCGFRYVAVIGYDIGDVFFDGAAGKAKTLSWFESKISRPAALRGLSIELELVGVDNRIKKPGPVFTAVTKAAYDLGASYFYRVNDDSEMHTPWARLFVDALEAMGPPYGVVGPESLNVNILVHDFTHRLHMDIFDKQYYPASLTDWFVDDWISRVYGNARTIRAKNCKVEHHTGAHGQRYKEDMTKAGSVNGLVEVGARKISAWAFDHGAEAAARQILSDKLDGKSASKAQARDI